MGKANRERYHFEKGLEIAPETPYLIEDVEDLINRHFDTFLQDAPFHIEAHDFHPELVSGEQSISIDELGFNYLPPAPKTFIGMDVQMEFPSTNITENPINIALKWSNNTQVRLAVASGHHLLLAEESGENGKTFNAEALHPEIFKEYIKNIGLPDSFWGDDIKEMTRDLYSCPDFSLRRAAKTQVDTATTLEVVHDARLIHDTNDKKQLVQELCINIDHDRNDIAARPQELYLPPQPSFRNMLRFERTNNNDSWKFAGAYHGKLQTGQFIDELEQINPTLGIPSSKVLDKALSIFGAAEPRP